MSETPQPPNRNWELMKARLDNFRIRARFAADQVVHDAKYKALVPGEVHERASLMAEAFTGEAMSFLRDNLTAKLKPVQPTREQVGIFQFLMDSIDNGTLVLKDTIGRVRESKRPFVVKRYQASEHEQIDCGSTLYAGLSDLLSVKDVHLTTRWGVRDGIVPGFAVFGSMGLAMPRSIDFLAFPKKAESSEEVQAMLGIPKEQSGFTSTVGVYSKGERIILNREGIYKGEEVSLTDQYYLVGAFDGEGTQRSYWLYGSNGESHSKMSVRQGIGVRKFAPQTSESK